MLFFSHKLSFSVGKFQTFDFNVILNYLILIKSYSYQKHQIHVYFRVGRPKNPLKIDKCKT